MKLNRFAVLLLCFAYQILGSCWCLNEEVLGLLRFKEGIVSDPFGALLNWNASVGEPDPCLWYRVECSDGKVVALNLKDLCLGGTLASDLRRLTRVQSIILRNNSFTGRIPEELGELKELKVLDLGYNNFIGPLPHDLSSSPSLAILLLDNNRLLDGLSSQVYELGKPFQFQKGKQSISQFFAQTYNAAHRKLLQRKALSPSNAKNEETRPPVLSGPSSPIKPFPPRSSASPAPAPSPSSSPSASVAPRHPSIHKKTPSPVSSLPRRPSSLEPSPSQSPAVSARRPKSNRHLVAILAGCIGGGVFLSIVIGIYICQGGKVATVKPWATGLSGQLQKAFVTGVPKLKRSELLTACEDFSNVIGSSPIGTVYKGILSNGVEIAVASVNTTSSKKDWSKNLELQFMKKVETLSKVNHKNFVNLLGFCVEEDPFIRMMVFEYAPNGTLFEHLHYKEAEHLDWGMRSRIMMGMAYCLDHMHQLNPPIAHNKLDSSAVILTEDYAAKISELTFWNELAASGTKPSNIAFASPESNVYSFGLILFEMVTGKIPYSVDDASLDDWATNYLKGGQRLKEIVDPALSSYDGEQVENIGEVINLCVHPNPDQRPTMTEVAARMREITSITPDGAIPKLSPLWWAELEIMTTEGI